MKTIFMAAAATIALTTFAFANDFEDTTYEMTVYSGALDFNIEATDDEFSSFEGGLSFLDHGVGDTYEGNVRAFTEYDFIVDEFTFGAEYVANWNVAHSTALYGAIGLEYAALENDLDNGDFQTSPYIGITHSFNKTISAFAEVGYTWDLQDFRTDVRGGYAEIGMPVNVTDTVAIVPSLIQTFDVPNETLNANIEVVLNF